MSFSRKRNLRSVAIEVEMVQCTNCLNSDCSSFKCIKKYKCSSSAMASQRHMACKSSNNLPAKNIGVKNPLLVQTSAKSSKLQATVEESNNLIVSKKNFGSKIPVAVKTAKIKKGPVVTTKRGFVNGSNDFKGLPIAEPIELFIGRVEATTELIEPTGEAIESTGTAIESTGKAIESTGKAIESTGEAIESTGEAAIESTGEAAIESTGKSIESTGKAIESTGEAIESTGEAIESTGESIELTGVAIESSDEPINSTSDPFKSTDKPIQPTRELIELVSEPAKPITKEPDTFGGAQGFSDSISKLHGVELPIMKVDHIKTFQRLLLKGKFFDEQVDYYGEMYRGKDYKEMVRLTSRKILADEFLKDYSFLGKTKLPLIEYNKVVDLIIKAVEKQYRDIGELSILNYFKDEYVKGAPGRLKNKK